VVEHIASRIAVMYLGRVIVTGRSSDVFSQARHPYTSDLPNSVLAPAPHAGIPDIRLRGLGIVCPARPHSA
jgi:peptide/nickel transport system ATP-binding protein